MVDIVVLRPPEAQYGPTWQSHRQARVIRSGSVFATLKLKFSGSPFVGVRFSKTFMDDMDDDDLGYCQWRVWEAGADRTSWEASSLVPEFVPAAQLDPNKTYYFELRTTAPAADTQKRAGVPVSQYQLINGRQGTAHEVEGFILESQAQAHPWDIDQSPLRVVALLDETLGHYVPLLARDDLDENTPLHPDRVAASGVISALEEFVVEDSTYDSLEIAVHAGPDLTTTGYVYPYTDPVAGVVNSLEEHLAARPDLPPISFFVANQPYEDSPLPWQFTGPVDLVIHALTGNDENTNFRAQTSSGTTQAALASQFNGLFFRHPGARILAIGSARGDASNPGTFSAELTNLVTSVTWDPANRDDFDVAEIRATVLTALGVSIPPRYVSVDAQVAIAAVVKPKISALVNAVETPPSVLEIGVGNPLELGVGNPLLLD